MENDNAKTMESKRWVKTFESFLMSRINENSGDEHELEIRTENAPCWWGTKMIPGDKNRPKHPDYGYGYKFDFSKLLDIEELSEELSLKPEDLKNYIDELSETTVFVQKKIKITKEKAKEKLIDYLWRHREDPNGMSILVSGWILKPQTLLDRGIEPGPIFGKLIKEFKDLYQDKRVSVETYMKNIDDFLKSKGY